ncbi:MAG TPA: hypothetical protein VFH68_25435 [Polyangia bacterium]|nr:hypothetical protein [Polyangia bacterium]
MIRCAAAFAMMSLFAGCQSGEGARRAQASVAVRAAAAPAPPSPEPLGAPRGWHAWPMAPAGCRLFVPDDLAALVPPPDTPCAGLASGCRVFTAPWAARSGWGFGGLLSAVRRAGATWIAMSRAPDAGWWESLVLRDGRVVAGFRTHIPLSGCTLGGPWLERGDGPGAPRAALVVVRAAAQNAPTALLGPADSLVSGVDRVEEFGPPAAALVARDVALVTPTQLILFEHGGRFTLRTLSAALDDVAAAARETTFRPRPDDRSFAYLQQPSAAGNTVLYAAWDGVRGELWRVLDGRSERVLGEEGVSYDALAGDGAHVAWTRARARRGVNRFDEVVLWAAAADRTGTLQGPHRVARLPAGELPLVSVGDGWVAARLGASDVRLYRLSDGRERRLPVLAGIGWDGGPSGLVVAGDEVIVKGYLVGQGASAGNDVRVIARFQARTLRSAGPDPAP